MNPPGDFDTFDSTVYAPQFMQKSRQVSSRLAKKEQSKLARQTILLVVLSILLLVGFIFIALPAVIRFAMDTSSFEQLTTQDTIPPQIPVISAPPRATSDTTLQISGFGEAKSTIQSVVNKKEANSITASDDGSFDIEVALEEGDNTIAFYSVDAAGNESALSREFSVVVKLTPPSFTLDEPKPGQVFETVSNRIITVSGVTDEGSRVFLNNRVLRSTSDGTFSGTIQLSEGTNVLVFRVVDIAGNEIEESVEVEFQY